MNTPENIKNSTEINDGEKERPVETFIINNFIDTNDSKDQLHIETITDILKNKVIKLILLKLEN